MGASLGADFHHQQQQPAPQGMPPPPRPHHHQQQPAPQGMPPPPRPNGRAQPTLQTSLSLAAAASSEQAGSPPDTQERLSNSDAGHNSATESASSRETWPGEPSKSGGGALVVAAAPITALRIAESKDKEVVGIGNGGVSELQALRGRMSLREIARDRVDLVADKMKVMSEEHMEEMKTELRSILEGTGGSC